MGVKGDLYILMLWLGFTLMIFSSCGSLLIVPIISAYEFQVRKDMLAQWPLPHIKLAIMITGLVT